MNRKSSLKREIIPMDRRETVRQEIISVLERNTLSAKEISGIVRASEKEVYEHLAHIQKTVSKQGDKLKIVPAECNKCGFEFKKRERLKKPGKCPVCRSETIREPLFSIES